MTSLKGLHSKMAVNPDSDISAINNRLNLNVADIYMCFITVKYSPNKAQFQFLFSSAFFALVFTSPFSA